MRPLTGCKRSWMLTGAGDRTKKHFHYLSGTVYCRVCGVRLSYGRHRNRWGNYYEYYSCLSRIKPSGPCGS